MRDYQKYAVIVALFATMLYFALIVAAFGMISLFTNTDVVTEADAGPLVGPFMVGASAVVVLLFMAVIGMRTSPEKQHVAVAGSLLCGLIALVAFVVTGGLIYGVGIGEAVEIVLFAGARLGSPFSWSVGIIAAAVTLLYSIILASRVGKNGRPLWPWERRGE
ncbi:DUF6121 family protein [Leifsonia sp. A12D58]|uniref:DUF6121 family protein n=1 Tax=Leifsonia sp. A12D58 TaxID=3397674 RepID=UPI0039E0A190